MVDFNWLRTYASPNVCHTVLFIAVEGMKIVDSKPKWSEVYIAVCRGLSTKTMVCDCKVSWLPEWLQDKRLRSEVDVQCALPTSLRGQNLFDISSSEFMCDGEC